MHNDKKHDRGEFANRTMLLFMYLSISKQNFDIYQKQYLHTQAKRYQILHFIFPKNIRIGIQCSIAVPESPPLQTP